MIRLELCVSVSMLAAGTAWAQPVVGPLQAQNMLGELSRSAASARANIGAAAQADLTTERNRALAAEAGLAPLASPAFTGTPTAPTAASGTNSFQLATTAFVNAAIGSTTAISAAVATETTRAETAEASASAAAANALAVANAALPLSGGTLTGPILAPGVNGSKFVVGLDTTGATDEASVVQAAVNAAAVGLVSDLYLPPTPNGGCIKISSTIVAPGTTSWTQATNKSVRVHGAGVAATRICAGASMSALWQQASYAQFGGLTDLTLDGQNEVTVVLDHQTGDNFLYRNLVIKNAAAAGIVARLGAPNGSGGFLPAIENRVENVNFIGVDYALYPYTAMPATAFQVNSTDNQFSHLIGWNASNSIFQEGYEAASGNQWTDIHAYGYGTSPNLTAWQPQYCFRAAGFNTSWVSPRCDGATVAEMQIAQYSQSVVNGIWQWATGSAGSAAGIQIVAQANGSGVGDLWIHGNQLSGVSAANAIVNQTSGPNNSIGGNPGASYTASVLEPTSTGYDIGLDTASYNAIGVNGSAAGQRGFRLLTASKLRVSLNIQGAETGGNAGGDFYLDQYADDGATFLRHAIQISRASGLITFGGAILTPQYAQIDGAASTQRAMYFSTSGSNRTSINTQGAETGGNAGGDFYIDQFADNGSTFLRHALQITRSTGAANLAGNLTGGGTASFAGAVSSGGAVSGTNFYGTSAYVPLWAANGIGIAYYVPPNATDNLAVSAPTGVPANGSSPVTVGPASANGSLNLFSSGTGVVTINSLTPLVQTNAPGSSTTACKQGQVAINSAGAYLNVCVSTNVWKSIPFTSFVQ